MGKIDSPKSSDKRRERKERCEKLIEKTHGSEESIDTGFFSFNSKMCFVCVWILSNFAKRVKRIFGDHVIDTENSSRKTRFNVWNMRRTRYRECVLKKNRSIILWRPRSFPSSSATFDKHSFLCKKDKNELHAHELVRSWYVRRGIVWRSQIFWRNRITKSP